MLPIASALLVAGQCVSGASGLSSEPAIARLDAIRSAVLIRASDRAFEPLRVGVCDTRPLILGQFRNG
jgi:hypothetical protein